MQTIVIGHKNPDMDSICSALGYAELKRRQGHAGVVAGRAGNTNERVDFVLDRFGFEAPTFFADVSPRVEDVMAKDVITADAELPIYQAITKTIERKFRGLPVVDSQRHCVGLLSAFEISRHLLPPIESKNAAREVDASLEAVRATINGECLFGSDLERVDRLILVIAAMHISTLTRRLATVDMNRTVLIVGDRWNVQEFAIEKPVRAILITGNLEVEPRILQKAQAAGVTVIRSPHDTATTVLLARGAVSARSLIEHDFLSFAPETPILAVKEEVATSSQFVFPVVDEGKLVGVFSKSDFLKPIPRQLILVDHNERTQMVNGAEDIPVIEILDHHRVATPPTEAPILFMNLPVGSTSTIVAIAYRQAGLNIPVNVAGILMAGLISDTLNLTSPTATPTDAEVLRDLAKISGVNPTTLSQEIFSVGSPLVTLKPEDLILLDCKEYTELGHSFSVAQVEEMNLSQFEARREDILAALGSFRAARGYLFSVLLVTDVNAQTSLLLGQGDARFLEMIDYPEVAPLTWEMEGVVSRKKQVLPFLLGLLRRKS